MRLMLHKKEGKRLTYGINLTILNACEARSIIVLVIRGAGKGSTNRTVLEKQDELGSRAPTRE